MLNKSIVLAVVLVLGLFLGFNDSALAEEKGLVGHWKFDAGEGQTVKDLSGNGNDGTLTGHGPFWVKNGLKFDGVDDHVHVPASESLNITEQITFEAWVKPEKSNNPFNNVIITQHGTWFFGVMQNDKVHNYVKLPLEHQKEKEWNISVISKSCLKPDVFNHIAGTYDSKTGINKVYANGERVAGRIGDALPTPSPGDYYIGNAIHGTYYFHGIMKEVRIYNRTLTDQEIKEHYDKGTF